MTWWVTFLNCEILLSIFKSAKHNKKDAADICRILRFQPNDCASALRGSARHLA
jgi:hypothetical protein